MALRREARAMQVLSRLAGAAVELAWRLNGTGPSKFLDPIDRAVLQGPVDT